MNRNSFDIILSKFDNPKRVGKNYLVKCPAHDDKKASLSVGIGDDGRVLLNCFAGCETKNIVSAMGLEMKDLFAMNKNNSFEIEKTYDYTDENGKVLYQVCRLKGKDFRQRRSNGNGGWTWNLKSVKPVLYRLPELVEAVSNNQAIFITEGEKDADNLIKLGFNATCNSGGAGKWKKEYGDYLQGAEIVILPDNDAPGKKHALQVAENLYEIVKDIRILGLPDLPAKGDLSDWLKNGGTGQKLREQVKLTPI